MKIEGCLEIAHNSNGTSTVFIHMHKMRAIETTRQIRVFSKKWDFIDSLGPNMIWNVCTIVL